MKKWTGRPRSGPYPLSPVQRIPSTVSETSILGCGQSSSLMLRPFEARSRFESVRNLKSNVEMAVEKLYPSSEQHEQKVVVSDVAFGVIFLVGFGFWTAHLVSDGFSYWALLTGFFAVTGVGLLLLGFGYGSTLPGETAGAARQRGSTTTERATERGSTDPR